MNYKLIHDQLIGRARDRLLEGYTEKHRIVPGCMGGTYESSNVVRLTPKEHYTVHQLLIKIYPDNKKLIYAAKMMTVDSNGKRVNNRLYEWLKRKFVEEHSKRMKGTKRSIESCKKQSQSMLGVPKSPEHCANISKGKTGKKHTKEARARMSASSKGQIAWNKGIPRTNEEKRKISDALQGNTNAKGNKGQVPWNKGKTGIYSAETLNLMSAKKKGRSQSVEHIRKRSEAKKGKTWEEIYGVEGAEQRRAAHKARAKA